MARAYKPTPEQVGQPVPYLDALKHVLYLLDGIEGYVADPMSEIEDANALMIEALTVLE